MSVFHFLLHVFKSYGMFFRISLRMEELSFFVSENIVLLFNDVLE